MVPKNDAGGRPTANASPKQVLDAVYFRPQHELTPKGWTLGDVGGQARLGHVTAPRLCGKMRNHSALRSRSVILYRYSFQSSPQRDRIILHHLYSSATSARTPRKLLFLSVHTSTTPLSTTKQLPKIASILRRFFRRPASPASMAAAKTKAQSIIDENGVAVFSKSYCPFCKATKALLTEQGANFYAIEMDQVGECNLDGFAISNFC